MVVATQTTAGVKQHQKEEEKQRVARSKILVTPAVALAIVLFLAVVWPGAKATAELSSTPREETWVFDGGEVDAITTTLTTTCIGGSFTYVGQTRAASPRPTPAQGCPWRAWRG
jgi:hypothetical protein